MGKLKGNKSNVKNNIFKLAGCQSLKTKNKAKAVTADRLKQVCVLIIILNKQLYEILK